MKVTINFNEKEAVKAGVETFGEREVDVVLADIPEHLRAVLAETNCRFWRTDRLFTDNHTDVLIGCLEAEVQRQKDADAKAEAAKQQELRAAEETLKEFLESPPKRRVNIDDCYADTEDRIRYRKVYPYIYRDFNTARSAAKRLGLESALDAKIAELEVYCKAENAARIAHVQAEKAAEDKAAAEKAAFIEQVISDSCDDVDIERYKEGAMGGREIEKLVRNELFAPILEADIDLLSSKAWHGEIDASDDDWESPDESEIEKLSRNQWLVAKRIRKLVPEAWFEYYRQIQKNRYSDEKRVVTLMRLYMEKSGFKVSGDVILS